MSEIKRSVIGWNDVRERVRDFRRARVDALTQGRLPLPIPGDQLIVFHVVPVEMFASDTHIDVRRSETESPNWPRPLDASHINTTYTLEGRITYEPQPGDKPREIAGARAYTLLFRNGAIETVNSTFFQYSDSIHPHAIADRIRKILPGWVHGLETRQISGPYFVSLSLLGFEGTELYREPLRGQSPWWGLQDDKLLLPGVLVDDLQEDPADTLRTLWDYLWQTCGYEGFTDRDRDELINS